MKDKTQNKKILDLLEYYTITREDVKKSDNEYLELKKKFDHLIESDQFIDLTLTYDYEERGWAPAASPCCTNPFVCYTTTCTL